MSNDLTLTQLRALVSAATQIEIGDGSTFLVRVDADRWRLVAEWTGSETLPLAECLQRLGLAPSVPSGWERHDVNAMWFERVIDGVGLEVDWDSRDDHAEPWQWQAENMDTGKRERGRAESQSDAIAAAEAAVEKLRGGR